MPSDPHQCRLHARRCLALAKRARSPETQRVFAMRGGLTAEEYRWKLIRELLD
jgi:hypothetical protein